MIAAAGRAGASGDLQRAVVVAVIAVRMVQMTVDQVIHVVTMRHRFVPAAGTVHMAVGMAGAVVLPAITCSSTWSPCTWCRWPSCRKSTWPSWRTAV
jgi:hypothetical protein